MEILLTNTMSRRKEVFKPLREGEVGIYTCGLTVYNFAHIGNLRAYVFADTLKRMFLFNGYKVNHVMNITDVGHLTGDEDEGEDKMEAGARREGKTVWEIVDFYTEAFFDDLKRLRIIFPTVTCRATRHIDDMIDMIRKIESNGYTYVAGGNVYFDTSKLPDYGKLARLKLDEDNTRSRVESDPYKRNPFDFVLWFTRYKYDSHAMQWDSPWGRGFPGWHIECSAMSSKYLGERFDIHTGGIDHIPIHHTNEIAQSEAAFGHEWVNYWLHSEFLVIGEGEKMSKSLGNFITLQTLIDKGYDPAEYRYYLLGAHYKKQLAFTLEALDGAKSAMKRLTTKIGELKGSEAPVSKLNSVLLNEFHEAINDDLNTPRALAVLWKVVDSEDLRPGEKLSLINEFDRVLGLGLSEIETEVIPEEVEELANQRDQARRGKDWKKADELRKLISEKGYEVLDERDGYKIRKK
ncbi:cysteine--tRNA ligase [Mesotoga sp. Brook.08.YT.4.2.5.1]|uniref:cysteine--tRNA ligase n=1 Tax=unclassified Mesotoga TaxID=1184398 RepID=UPI000C17909F|nr:MULTISPECIES: cysteine--tRNA ligase [unclassified Mesotoga]PNE20093.1 cysteine--tRNA ligase [Mesotoga sp. Brook.08.YT.4.2.5.1]PNS38203.1 cysteine--tRNA ligase [Mesotoga sp. B105.6.4]PVD16923.1 cysteinyl-tRNA synthetase [Mesotoga sp. Brook.08.105.5.1]RAO97366.1 cysteinyl-tRNA synthetase [Mesotoga sp. Brook.08.YT.4.2.5.4.]RDI91628.1 cysteine--tRNA ligase [Mesotoga sp. Brook.08.YT.4.2.5.2.]